MATPRETITRDVPVELLDGLPPHEWKQVVRSTLVYDILGHMLKVYVVAQSPPTRVGGPGSSVETYSGFVTSPLWNRGKHTNHSKDIHALMRCQVKHTKVISDSVFAEVNIGFVVELRFETIPRRSLNITIYRTECIEDAEVEENFLRLCKVFILRWMNILLRARVEGRFVGDVRPIYL